MTMTIQTTESCWDVRTHNGCITIKNPATGQHRTFRVRTQPKDSKFCPGTRIASLLVGSDNTTDYVGFGFVDPNRGVLVWQKKRDSVYDKFATMLNQPGHYERKYQMEYLVESTCRMCNRPLTNPESIKSGVGPICGGNE